MSYTKTTWVDVPDPANPPAGAKALNATNLNHIEDGIYNATETADGKYAKPSGGIPKTDLASSVQTSLDKADSALQTHQDISGKQDLLVSGTNIKTINGNTILGGGDIGIIAGTQYELLENIVLTEGVSAILREYASLKAIRVEIVIENNISPSTAVNIGSVSVTCCNSPIFATYSYPNYWDKLISRTFEYGGMSTQQKCFIAGIDFSTNVVNITSAYNNSGSYAESPLNISTGYYLSDKIRELILDKIIKSYKIMCTQGQFPIGTRIRIYGVRA